jgi:two-component system KDP operon response regulator KdpE
LIIKPTVLVIDDEKEIRKLLRIILEDQNYAVEEAENGHQGLVEAAQRKPDIVLLDLGLPDMDGLIVLKRLREWSQVPVLVLTVRDDSADKVAALDCGADDYVTKPFTTVELLARLRAIQRRSKSNNSSDPFFQVRHLSIDFVSRTVRVKGQEVKLTSIEYSLLKILAQHAGKVVTHKHLLREVWGPNAEEQSQYLRVYVNHLRNKIELPQGGAKLIRTETGIGYRLLLADD